MELYFVFIHFITMLYKCGGYWIIRCITFEWWNISHLIYVFTMLIFSELRNSILVSYHRWMGNWMHLQYSQISSYSTRHTSIYEPFNFNNWISIKYVVLSLVTSIWKQRCKLHWQQDTQCPTNPHFVNNIFTHKYYQSYLTLGSIYWLQLNELRSNKTKINTYIGDRCLHTLLQILASPI